MKKLKGTTLWHLEEIVAQAFSCPHCGMAHRFDVGNFGWHELDETVTCDSCGEEFVLDGEDWDTA